MTRSTGEDVFNMTVNGLTLNGVQTGGVWRWVCPAYPDLAATHSGKADPTPMVVAFMGRALFVPTTFASPPPGEGDGGAG